MDINKALEALAGHSSNVSNETPLFGENIFANETAIPDGYDINDAQTQADILQSYLNPVPATSFNVNEQTIQDIITQYSTGVTGQEPVSNKRINPAYVKWQQQKVLNNAKNKAIEKAEADFKLAEEDIVRIQQAGPEAAENIRELASLAMRANLKVAGNEESEVLSQQILHMMKDYEPFKHMILIETDYDLTFDELYVPPKGPNPILSAVGWAFSQIDRPLQATYKIVMDVKNGEFASAGSRLVEAGIDVAEFATLGLSDKIPGRKELQSWLDTQQTDASQYDLNKDGRIDFNETGFNPLKNVPVLGTITNFAGDVVFDPITWASLGVGAIFKNTMKAAAGTIRAGRASEKGLKTYLITAGAVKKGSLIRNASDDAVDEIAFLLKEGMDNNIPWKKLEVQLKEALGNDYSKELVDEILESVFGATMTRGTASKFATTTQKAIKAQKAGNVSRADRLQERAKGLADELNIGEDEVSALIKDKQRKIKNNMAKIKQRQGGGLAFGAGRARFYVPGTQPLYQWFKKNGIAINPSRFYKGSKVIPRVFGNLYGVGTTTDTVVQDIGVARFVNDMIYGKTEIANPRTGQIGAQGYFGDTFTLDNVIEQYNKADRPVGQGRQKAPEDGIQPKDLDTERIETIEGERLGADGAMGPTVIRDPANPTGPPVLPPRLAVNDERARRAVQILLDTGRIVEVQPKLYMRAGAKSRYDLSFENLERAWREQQVKGMEGVDQKVNLQQSDLGDFQKNVKLPPEAKSLEQWVRDPFNTRPPLTGTFDEIFDAVSTAIDKIDNQIDQVLSKKKLSRADHEEVARLEYHAQELYNQAYYFNQVQLSGYINVDNPELVLPIAVATGPKKRGGAGIKFQQIDANTKASVENAPTQGVKQQRPDVDAAGNVTINSLLKERGINVRVNKDGTFNRSGKLYREVKEQIERANPDRESFVSKLVGDTYEGAHGQAGGDGRYLVDFVETGPQPGHINFDQKPTNYTGAIPFDETVIETEGKLLHGAYDAQSHYEDFIDPDTGDLILMPAENFGGKVTSVSFTESVDTAVDYATRVKGAGPSFYRGIVFEIDRAAVEAQATLIQESGEEVATSGSQVIRIPKDKFRAIDTRTAKNIKDNAVEFDKEIADLSKLSDDDLIDRLFELLDKEALHSWQTETMDGWEDPLIGFAPDITGEKFRVEAEVVRRLRRYRPKISPEGLDEAIQSEMRRRYGQAVQDAQQELKRSPRPIAMQEEPGAKSKTKRRIASQQANKHANQVFYQHNNPLFGARARGLWQFKYEKAEVGIGKLHVAPTKRLENMTPRERRHFDRMINVTDGANRTNPEEWYRKAASWINASKASKAIKRETMENTSSPWTARAEIIGEQLTYRIDGVSYEGFLPPGWDLEANYFFTSLDQTGDATKRISAVDYRDRKAVERELKEEHYIRDKDKKRWDAMSKKKRESLVDARIAELKRNRRKTQQFMPVEYNKSTGIYEPVTGTAIRVEGGQAVAINKNPKTGSFTVRLPGQAFGPEDVGSYQPSTYADTSLLKRGTARVDDKIANPLGYIGPRPFLGDDLEQNTSASLFNELTNDVVEILEIGARSGEITSFEDFVRLIENASDDKSLASVFEQTAGSPTGAQQIQEKLISRGEINGFEQRTIPNVFKGSTKRIYEKATPQSLMSRNVNRALTPVFAPLRALDKRSGSLRSFIALSNQGSKFDRDFVKEAKSQRLASARQEGKLRVEALNSYRNMVVKKIADHLGVDGEKALQALIGNINLLRTPKHLVDKTPAQIRLNMVGQLGEEITDDIKRIVDEINNYSVEQYEIIVDISGDMKMRNPEYDPEIKKGPGNQEFIPLDPESFNPRVMSDEAVAQFAKIFNAESDDPLFTLASTITNKEAIADYVTKVGISKGWDDETIRDAIDGWDSLMKAVQDAAGGSHHMPASLNASRMLSVLTESGHMRARAFMPAVQNIQEVNEFIRDVMNSIAANVSSINKGTDKGTVDYLVTRFYDDDPVQAFIRYSESFDDQKVVYDLLNDLEELTLIDAGTGMDRITTERPAVLKSEMRIEKVATQDAVDRGKMSRQTFGEVDADYENRYVFTYVDESGKENTIRGEPGDTLDQFQFTVESRLQSSYGGEYKAVEVGSGFRIVDAKLADEIKTNVIGQLKNDHVQGKFNELMSAWTTGWASYVTVPLIGFAFHSRNMVGNFFNMAVGGFKNPAMIGKAFRLQALNKGVHDYMTKFGILSYDDALSHMIKTNADLSDLKGFTARGKASKITSDDVRNLRLINESGIVTPGFFQDLGYDQGLFDRKGRKGNRKTKTEMYLNNPITRSGRRWGSMIEDNARIAMFLDGMEQGLGTVGASARTKQFLLDYTDLTAGERRIKNYSRFYTWMRKNTPLQMRMLASQPGTVINTQRMLDGIMQSVLGVEKDAHGKFMPEFMQDSGFFYNPNTLFTARLETPLISAIETLEKVAYLSTIGDLNPLVPWDYKEIKLKDRLNDSLGLLSSGPQAGIIAGLEEITGSRIYSGAPIPDGPAYMALFRLLSASALPVITKTMRELARYSDKDPLGIVSNHQQMDGWFSDTDKLLMGLANSLWGIQTYQLNEEQQLRYIGFLNAEYDEQRRKLANKDIVLPTLADLRRDGLLSEANRIAKIRIFAEDKMAALEYNIQSDAQQVVAELGLPFKPPEEREPKSLEDHARDIQDQIEMIELFANDDSKAKKGDENYVSLSPQMKLQIALSLSGGLTNTELESLGIEPIRKNQFIETAREEENMARAREWFNVIVQSAGVTPSQARVMAPVIPDAVRYMQDAVEAGIPIEQAVATYLDDMSKTKKNLLGIPTEVAKFDTVPSAKDLMKLQRNAAQAVAEIQLIAYLFGIRDLGDGEIMSWILYGTNPMTNRELQSIGLPSKPVVPQAENRTDPATTQQIAKTKAITLEQLLAS
jgi:hypothetical protein